MTDVKTFDDVSLEAVPVTISDLSQYAASSRKWQGIAGICWAGGDRLLATWYSGGKTEGPENYVAIGQSDDFGKTWTEPVAVVAPAGNVRAFDSTLWRSPDGKVWLFWAQGWSPKDIEIWDGRAGVWCSVCEAPQADELVWSQPKRISDGIMLNKPCVTKNGDWLLPVAIWNRQPYHPDTKDRCSAGLVVSRDQGQTFKWVGGAKILENVFDEHVVFERGDELVLWARTADGMAESISIDAGETWSESYKNGLDCPNSRFNIARLSDGKLLLVNHVRPDLDKATYLDMFSSNCWHGRNNLSVMLSEDDGKTWQAECLIDARQGVSYPDADVTPDGRIVVIYDYDRFGCAEINVAVMTQEDIIKSRQPEIVTISSIS